MEDKNDFADKNFDKSKPFSKKASSSDGEAFWQLLGIVRTKPLSQVARQFC